MSATDQAFIRAYNGPGAVAASVPPHAHLRTPTSIDDQAANSADESSIAPPANPWGATTSQQSTANPSHTRITSVHVGLGSVIPAPHAAFASKIAASMASGSQQTTSTPTLSASIVPIARGSLSSFTTQLSSLAATPHAPRPALEIDAIRWPNICQQLATRCADRFDRLADELRREIETGTHTLAITGTHRREGRTTLALCLARRLAAANIKVVLVEADFANPRLANQLSLGIQHGWETVLTGEESPWEVMIESMADRLSILPLASPVTNEDVAIGSYRIAATLQELAEHYELILLDAGPIGLDDQRGHWLFETSAGVQATILAYDVRRGEPHHIAAGCLQLAQAGLRQLGLAELFTTD